MGRRYLMVCSTLNHARPFANFGIGSLSSLKNVKKDVQEMKKGGECGIGFDGWFDFQVGDHVQSYEEISEKRYL